MRYLDSRKDEQERGITMKSSCISLGHIEGEALLNIPQKLSLFFIQTITNISSISSIPLDMLTSVAKYLQQSGYVMVLLSSWTLSKEFAHRQ